MPSTSRIRFEPFGIQQHLLVGLVLGVEVEKVVSPRRASSSPPALAAERDKAAERDLGERLRLLLGLPLEDRPNQVVGIIAGETLGDVDDLHAGLQEEMPIVTRLVGSDTSEPLEVVDQHEAKAPAILGVRDHVQEALPVFTGGA